MASQGKSSFKSRNRIMAMFILGEARLVAGLGELVLMPGIPNLSLPEGDVA
jgi:hypothetical protein